MSDYLLVDDNDDDDKGFLKNNYHGDDEWIDYQASNFNDH